MFGTEEAENVEPSAILIWFVLIKYIVRIYKIASCRKKSPHITDVLPLADAARLDLTAGALAEDFGCCVSTPR